jgi:TolB-like protein/DNA-binding winged helix-turn-helix (wHTH) protein
VCGLFVPLQHADSARAKGLLFLTGILTGIGFKPVEIVINCASLPLRGSMVATPTQSRILKFALFEVDLEAGELRKSGMRQKLAGQPFEVLRLLLERPQEIVTREELQQRIWPKDTFVDYDLALRKAIARLREVLGDSAESPRFIETVPRRGYRFIAVLNRNGDAHALAELPTEGAPAETRRSRRSLQIGIVLGLGVAALLLALLGLMPDKFRWRRSGTSAAPQIRSLAVLPLQNLSADPAQEYFSDGMTDALITDLAQIGSLKVISRTSTIQYKGTKRSLPEIARELNVDGIIEGTVQRSGNRVRITAQLIYGPSDKHLWANSYERDMRDVFALERDVTEDIARQIQARLTTKNRPEQAQPLPMDPKALEAYLQGNYHLNKQGKGAGDEEKKKAAEYFQQAITADPNFAPSYNGLALAHENLLLGSSEDVAVSRKAAEKAVEIDPNYSDARVTLAGLKWIPDLDWRGAEEDLRRAIALNPNSAFARSGLCILLVVLGHAEEGMRECRIAQRLDPFDDDSALGLYLGRDYDGSIAMLRMMLQKDPNVGMWRCDLFPNYVMKGMYKESIQELERCYSLFGQSEAAAHLQRAFAVSGYHGAIRQWAKETEHLQAAHQAFLPGYLAEAYAILGDKDRAFYWLEQAYEHREMDSFDSGVFFLRAEPMYDPLRSDPRFKDLLLRVGLPQ